MDIGVGLPAGPGGGPGGMSPHSDLVGMGARSGSAVSSGRPRCRVRSRGVMMRKDGMESDGMGWDGMG